MANRQNINSDRKRKIQTTKITTINANYWGQMVHTETNYKQLADSGSGVVKKGEGRLSSTRIKLLTLKGCTEKDGWQNEVNTGKGGGEKCHTPEGNPQLAKGVISQRGRKRRRYVRQQSYVGGQDKPPFKRHVHQISWRVCRQLPKLKESNYRKEKAALEAKKR